MDNKIAKTAKGPMRERLYVGFNFTDPFEDEHTLVAIVPKSLLPFMLDAQTFFRDHGPADPDSGASGGLFVPVTIKVSKARDFDGRLRWDTRDRFAPPIETNNNTLQVTEGRMETYGPGKLHFVVEYKVRDYTSWAQSPESTVTHLASEFGAVPNSVAHRKNWGVSG